MTYRVLKGAGYSPSEVNLKKSIEEMRHKIRDELDPDRKNKLMMEMNRIETELNIKLEQMASKT